MVTLYPWTGIGTAQRPLLMFVAARWPVIPYILIPLRALTLLAVGNPLTTATVTVAAFTGLAVFPPAAWAALTALAVALETANTYTTPRYATWRRAWALRRRWPTQYAVVDHTTADVQASFGGGISTFLGASKKLTRPVFKHPPLGWWPTFGDRSVSWRCGAPPGTTLPKLAAALPALAATITHPDVSSLDLDFESDTDSWGRLTVWFGAPPDDLADIDPDTLPDDLADIDWDQLDEEPDTE